MWSGSAQVRLVFSAGVENANSFSASAARSFGQILAQYTTSPLTPPFHLAKRLVLCDSRDRTIWLTKRPALGSRCAPLFQLRLNRERDGLLTNGDNQSPLSPAATGRVGTAVAAENLLSAGTSMLGFGSLAQARTPEPLTQPPEIRSANNILQTTITAAPGPVRIGDREFSGLLYDGAYTPRCCARASAKRCGSPSVTTCQTGRRICTYTA
jgi:hypothetical protein